MREAQLEMASLGLHELQYLVTKYLEIIFICLSVHADSEYSHERAKGIKEESEEERRS